MVLERLGLDLEPQAVEARPLVGRAEAEAAARMLIADVYKSEYEKAKTPVAQDTPMVRTVSPRTPSTRTSARPPSTTIRSNWPAERSVAYSSPAASSERFPAPSRR